MKFHEFNLSENLLKGIEKAGFADCMDVQVKTLEYTLEKRDVYVQSQTGSGKTAAFLISILELFSREALRTKRAVVIVPTRELAVQIEEEAKLLCSALPFTVGSFYGGVGYVEQERMLRDRVNIIVGTPGRLIDLSQTGKLNFGETSILVIDEADRLFDMGFLPDLRRMLRKMPQRTERMAMLFSATLNSRVWHLAWEYMNDPVEVIMNPEQLTVNEITQELYHVSRSEKMKLLLGLLDREKPESTLIFVNTKNSAVELAQRLSHNGHASQFIIGDLPQKKRLQVIEEMKSGKLPILVATDVAARGLHIDDLDLVVNFDLPEDPELYVHRIGRTARAGKTGKAITLACERFVYSLEAIQAMIEMRIPVFQPEASLFREDMSAAIHFGRSKYVRGKAELPQRRRSMGTGDRRPHPVEHPPSHRPHPAPAPGAPRASSRSERAPDYAANRRKKAAAAEHAAARRRPSIERGNEAETRASRDTSMEERLAYYKRKYGESFAIKESRPSETAPTGAPAVSEGKADGRRRALLPFLERLFGRRSGERRNAG